MTQPREERNDRPPSYSAPALAPALPNAAPQQVIYMPQGGVLPQQGYIIQNVPVQGQTNCCSGRSDEFKNTAGVSVGVIQLVVAVIAIVLSALTYVLLPDTAYPGMGGAIGGAVVFYIPAGILGILTKSKNNCVIIGYLVMAILAAINAAYITGVEGCAAAFFSTTINCNDYYIPEMESIDDYPIDRDVMIEPKHYQSCGNERVTSVFVLHIVVSVLCFIEFIVAIVGAAYCCGGLRCCCKQTPQQRGVTMMYYTPIGQEQTTQVQVEGQAAGEAGPLPQKA